MVKNCENKTPEIEPNYEIPCEVCGQTPTVDIIFADGCVNHSELCGVCYWGEAECIDPENW